jgi:hypothetical protein
VPKELTGRKVTIAIQFDLGDLKTVSKSAQVQL